jgi:hypothetical protein
LTSFGLSRLALIMSKHTPGPWRAITSYGACFHHGNRVSIVSTIDEFDQTVAEVWPTDGDSDIADGSLIAAAPETKRQRDELLAALDDLCGPGAQFELVCDEAEHDESSGCVWCEARAAIAKATGAKALTDDILTGGTPEEFTAASLADLERMTEKV